MLQTLKWTCTDTGIKQKFDAIVNVKLVRKDRVGLYEHQLFGQGLTGHS